MRQIPDAWKFYQWLLHDWKFHVRNLHARHLAKQVVISALLLSLAGSFALAAEEEENAALPAPRDAAGNIIIGRSPGEKSGIWVPDYRNRTPSFNVDDIHFKPWAKGLYETRQSHDLEPHARCKASGAVRQLLTPYGVEIVHIAQLQRLYIFDIGGPHSFREVFMDGRPHPEDLAASNYGHSIGWWEGDTLVIDSVGYNTDFWFERSGLPHTEAAHVTEYFTRINYDSMEYRFELEDKHTYDNTVIGTVNLRWAPDQALFEYICQQSNYASELMVNDQGNAVGSSSVIVP